MNSYYITKRIALLSIVLGLAACGINSEKNKPQLPEASRPLLPEPIPNASPADQPQIEKGITKQAHRLFWKTFRNEEYRRLGKVAGILTAAYMQNPKNPQTVLLLAHTYLWRVAERNRVGGRGAHALSDLILAKHYFEEAYRLSPNDARIIGWLASVRLPLARIMQDKTMIQRAYATLHKGVAEYPAFNHFTAAYILARLTANSEHYLRALEHMRNNRMVCPDLDTGESSNSTHKRNMSLVEKQYAVCGNTKKAPYNIQGFLMSYGDMLAKAGKIEKAINMYQSVKVSPDYESWPYRGALEKRLRLIQKMQNKQGQPETVDDNFPLMWDSKYVCAACHAKH